MIKRMFSSTYLERKQNKNKHSGIVAKLGEITKKGIVPFVTSQKSSTTACFSVHQNWSKRELEISYSWGVD